MIPALLIYDITDPARIALAATVPIPPAYGIHDTYVRDGLAFVFAWNTGVIIYDVGNGIARRPAGAPGRGEPPAHGDDGVAGGAAVHNGWWFHNPVTGENRYLFIGQEGAGRHRLAVERRHPCRGRVRPAPTPPRWPSSTWTAPGPTTSGWTRPGRSSTAAYYNGGVVALDVSGTLAGDLSNRLIAQIKPGGAGNTYVWGVQLAGGSLYAIDMLSGLWQLEVP